MENRKKDMSEAAFLENYNRFALLKVAISRDSICFFATFFGDGKRLRLFMCCLSASGWA